MNDHSPMKQPQNRSIWMFWLPLGLAMAIFLLVTFVGNILVIGSKLGWASPSLEFAFYGFVVIVFVWLIAAPLLGMLAKPVLALDDVTSGKSRANSRQLKKVARQLVDSGTLTKPCHDALRDALCRGSSLLVSYAENGKKEVPGPLPAAIAAQRETAVDVIRNHAVMVFVATAVSQSGRLDAFAVLATNVRLVRLLVRHFGYRPPLPTLVRIYAQICVASFIADELDDLNVDGILGHVGFGAAAAIPGMGLIVNSWFDGTVNALFTLRIGFVTRRCLLNAGNALTASEIRKVANQEARQELKSVMKESASKLPVAIGQVVEKLV